MSQVCSPCAPAAKEPEPCLPPPTSTKSSSTPHSNGSGTALLDPEFTRQYFHGTTFLSDFRPGSPYRNVLPGDRDAVEGVIEEIDPPHRLVMTWHVLYDAALAAEPPGRVEWRLAPANDDGSVTRCDASSRRPRAEPVDMGARPPRLGRDPRRVQDADRDRSTDAGRRHRRGPRRPTTMSRAPGTAARRSPRTTRSGSCSMPRCPTRPSC